MGGLKALSYFMNDFNKVDYKSLNYEDDLIEKAIENQKFHCCITLNSGANLQDAKVETLGLEQKEWGALLKAVDVWLNQHEKIILKKFPYYAELNKAFKALYFREDESDSDLIEYRKEKVNKILMNFFAISGGSDPIVNIRQMQRLSPEVSINQLIVAKGDHLIGKHTSEWQEVLPRVEKNILDFIVSCGVSYYKRNLIEEKLHELINEADFENYLKDNCKDDFSSEHLNEFLKKLSSPKKKKELKKWLHRSRIFYPKFNSLVRKIYKIK
ncbi:MAG: hypothetical protein IPJ79_18700 [Bacteroidetes bacterium]|nr:hypothetical protein [Bacteroidota bacterium]